MNLPWGTQALPGTARPLLLTRLFAAALPAALACFSVASADPPADAPRNADSRSTESAEHAAYDFELPFIDGGGKLSFEELAASGEPFVIVWWLTECPVCHLQLPYVEKLHNLAQDNGIALRVVGINLDFESSAAQDYLKKRSISFPVLSDPRGKRTDSLYGIKKRGTPVTYVFKAGGEKADVLSGFTSDYSHKVFDALGLDDPEN